MTRTFRDFMEVNQMEIQNIVKDDECHNYSGCSFQIDQFQVKYRKGRSTPRKIGYFVTLWKRNDDRKTEPFSITDDFQFYIIDTEKDNKHGIFLIPRTILSEKQVLSSASKQGKRGFRVYAPWDLRDSKQAERTKEWQTDYFIDLINVGESIEKFCSILRDPWPAGKEGII